MFKLLLDNSRTVQIFIYFAAGQDTEVVDHFKNLDILNIKSPIKVNILERLLKETNYDPDKTKYLVDGLTNGFDIGYHGKTDRRDKAANILLSIGTKTQIWNKVMKEVKAGRYAGPFKDKLPFGNYIQSPIGLVPKDGGKQTRLIFHLSYNFSESNKLMNACTPEQWFGVKYNDLDHVIENSLSILQRKGVNITYYSKTDVLQQS